MVRGQNMSQHDDEVLCTAYVNQTNDGLRGTNRPSTLFWDAVAEEYNTTTGITERRTGASLQTRYSKISRHVMLYVSKLKEASMTNRPSGTVNTDWVK